MDAKLGFIITAYDTQREVNFTVDLLRNKWKSTRDSLISIVISGDPDRKLKFPTDKRTRVTTLDDMVGDKFNELVSTSIMKQMTHAMIEMRDLQREFGQVDILIHMHGDILLLNEEGFLAEVNKFIQSGKAIGCDTVGPQGNEYIKFAGTEIMPQLFMVRRDFCDATGFMHLMNIVGESEGKSTEHALLGNLHRCTAMAMGTLYEGWPYEKTSKSLVHEVIRHRPSQWDVHRSYGGWCHFGNSIHLKADVRQARNEAVLKAYGLNMEKWYNG